VKKQVLIFIAIALLVVVVVPATVLLCTGTFSHLVENPEVHHHAWGQWGEPKNDDSSWIQFRSCTNCGLSEMRHVMWGK
jgi:hypothetical protein